MSIDSELELINIDDFSLKYSLDDLMENLKYNNLDLSILSIDVNNLFQVAIKFGLIDLIEYLYVWHNVEYEFINLISNIHINLENYSKNFNITETIIYDNGANDGLKLNYLSKSDQLMQKSINKLVELRKYSKMKSSNKKFYYKFNPKHINKFTELIK